MQKHWEMRSGRRNGKRFLHLSADQNLSERDLLLLATSMLDELRARVEERRSRKA